MLKNLSIDTTTMDHWRDVIEHIVIHHDAETGLMLQFEDFFERDYIAPDM